MPTKICASAPAGVAVVELGDRPGTQGLDEGAVGAGPLRDGDAEQDLALLADLGALGDVAQAVEVEVRAAGDRHQRAGAVLLPAPA